MRIAIVGPTHPYKGGIAQHTTELAHRLVRAGHEVSLVSWKAQYPFFYPGDQFVPTDKPELPPFTSIKRVLSWKNPAGWIRWARRLNKFDQVIFIWWVPTIQGPVYFSMLKALGKRGSRNIVICHNVIQHSAGPVDRQLTRLVLNRADTVITHTSAQAKLAKSLTKTPVSVAALPEFFTDQPRARPAKEKLHYNLLFFGLVRHYKGVDVLLRALSAVPKVRLTIAGEMWGKQGAKLQGLISELKLDERVTLQPGYVPASDIAKLFSGADALVLPYRTATATQNIGLAFAHGVPVIATKVGSMPGQLRDGMDGLLCEPGDATSLAEAIKHFYEPEVAEKLRANIPASTADTDWHNYIRTITNRSGS